MIKDYHIARDRRAVDELLGLPWALLLRRALRCLVLTLRPAANGQARVYVATALVWLRVVDGVKLSPLDWIAGVTVTG